MGRRGGAGMLRQTFACADDAARFRGLSALGVVAYIGRDGAGPTCCRLRAGRDVLTNKSETPVAGGAAAGVSPWNG